MTKQMKIAIASKKKKKRQTTHSKTKHLSDCNAMPYSAWHTNAMYQGV